MISSFNLTNRGKRLICALSTLIFIGLNAPTANAEVISIMCGEGVSYTLTIPSGVVENGSKCKGSLTIDPRVRIIGKNAFSWSKITSVTLSNNVTVIEADAFSYTNLSKINLGSAIESIGNSAFRNSKFESIELPQSLKVIGELAFADTYFKSISLPSSLLFIGSGAFSREDSQAALEEITIPDSVKTIEYAAFTRAGLKKVTLGAGIDTISSRAFMSNQIKEIRIPITVKHIQSFAFSRNPIEKVSFFEGLLSVDSEAFSYSNIETLSLPTSLTLIGTKAFAFNKKMSYVDVSDDYNPSIGADGKETIGDIFLENYAIRMIHYCGKATGFYVPPTCDGARKKAYEAKNLAELQKLSEEERSYQESQTRFQQQQAIEVAESIKKAQISEIPITIKVTGDNPVCPTDFVQLPNVNRSKGPFGFTILCQSVVKPESERLAAKEKQNNVDSEIKKTDDESKPKSEDSSSLNVDRKSVLENPNLLKYSNPTNKLTTKSKTIICLKGKTSLRVKDKSPRCPKGYVRKK